MNYYDLPEYASLAPFENTPAANSAGSDSASPSPLVRLVASIHRRAAAPRGYRFVANIDESELGRALLAVKQTSVAGEVRLVSPAVDDSGNPAPDVAVYVRDHLPDPAAFWAMFHSHCHCTAA